MKCVKSMESGKVVRTSDSNAKILVETSEGVWIYCAKNEWKKQAKSIADRRKYYAKG